MKENVRRILTALGMALAVHAFFFMLLAPTIVINCSAFKAPSECGIISGMDAILGNSLSNGDINYFTFIFQSGEYEVNMIMHLKFSIVNLIPLVLIDVGVIVFGIMALLEKDNKKKMICGITVSIFFLISGIIILLMNKFAVPVYELEAVKIGNGAVQINDIPPDIKQELMQNFVPGKMDFFKRQLTFGWGAYVGSILAFIAFVLTSIGVGLNFFEYKRKKIQI